MNDVSGFVAAGGLSSRMGGDKAWLQLDGRPMIQRVIDTLTAVASPISIIANTGPYETLGLPVYRDANLGVGPLEAIRVALATARSQRVIVLACDLPLVRPSLFEFLLSLPGEYQAIVPVGPDGHLETLCAVYSTKAVQTVSTLISEGRRMVRLLYERIETRRVEFEEFCSLAGSETFFENVNTPEDYERVRSRFQHPAPPEPLGAK
jgi:molybdopterin-guanine dinucleotide biosynthesis protein A